MAAPLLEGLDGEALLDLIERSWRCSAVSCWVTRLGTPS